MDGSSNEVAVGRSPAQAADTPEDSCTVLVVDDDPTQGHLLSAILKKRGYNTAIAPSGEEAIRIAHAVSPDLILLDVVLPDMDGYEVCSRIRKQESLSEIYIIMLTSLSDRESRLKGFEAGADDFISKPYDAMELTARVKTIARLNRYRRLVEERDRNTLLLSELHSAYNATLEGWSQALDLRDRDTEGHTQRVSNLTIHLARHLRIDEERQVDFYRGALLHDIGKIGVPDNILHKNGPLTGEEWEVMRRHPTHAYEMLRHIDFLQHSLEIPYCHHEWWDGTGYPQGLKGKDIPLSARIFSIIDVWDALVVDRPYRKAVPQEEVLAYIQEQAGTHFDPDIVAAFEEILQKPEVKYLYSNL